MMLYMSLLVGGPSCFLCLLASVMLLAILVCLGWYSRNTKNRDVASLTVWEVEKSKVKVLADLVSCASVNNSNPMQDNFPYNLLISKRPMS